MATLEEQLKQFEIGDRLIQRFVNEFPAYQNSTLREYLKTFSYKEIRELLTTPGSKFSHVPREDFWAGLFYGALIGTIAYIPSVAVLTVENFIRYGEMKQSFSDLFYGFLGLTIPASIVGSLMAIGDKYNFTGKVKKAFLQHVKLQREDCKRFKEYDERSFDPDLVEAYFPGISQFFDEKGELKIKVE